MPENWKDRLAQGVFEVTYTFDAGHSKKSTCTVFFVPIHYKLVNGDKVDKGLNMSVAYGNESFNFFVDYKILDAFTDSGTFYLLNPKLSNFHVFFQKNSANPCQTSNSIGWFEPTLWVALLPPRMTVSLKVKPSFRVPPIVFAFYLAAQVMSRLTNSTPAMVRLLKRLSVKDFLAFTSCCERTYKFAHDDSIWRHFLRRDFARKHLFFPLVFTV